MINIKFGQQPVWTYFCDQMITSSVKSRIMTRGQALSGQTKTAKLLKLHHDIDICNDMDIITLQFYANDADIAMHCDISRDRSQQGPKYKKVITEK